MCGIAAIVAYQNRGGTADGAHLERVIGRMSCRGPDGVGTWTSADGHVALGHRRLAIIDLSESGAQPMRSDAGGSALVISFNGEIYNFAALRRDLEQRGHTFRTGSDTEVLLRLYAEKGEAMLSDLRGMFAFALWDERRRELFLARDPFGIKPLYYAASGGVFRAASEVKALIAGGGVDTSPDPAGHVAFHLWGHVAEPYTLHAGIRALPAGCWMRVGAEGPTSPTRYADLRELLLEAESQAPAPVERVQDELRDALVDTVRHHLVADVDVGIFLSAGIDSTTLAALAAEQSGRLRTVTLGFDEYRGTLQDEAPLAEEVARGLGASHSTVRIGVDDFDAELERLLDRMDQPTIDGVNSYFVARAAAQTGLKVAMSGLGGDELFGSYPSFSQIPRLVGFAGRLPAAHALGRSWRTISAPVLRRFTSPKYASLLEYGGTYGGAYLLRRGLFMPWELPRILDGDLVKAGWSELQPLLRLHDTVDGIRAPRLRVSALEASWYMRNQLLRDTDWASMSHSLEVRVPFVDWTLWRRTVPLLLAQPSLAKRAIALTARPALPASLLDRPKSGFSIPTDRWIARRLGAAGGERGLRSWARHVYRRAA